MPAIFKPSGFLRIGTIVSTDPQTMTATVRFSPDKSMGTNERNGVQAQLPISFLSSGGGFIGGYVAGGTPVVVSQAEGSGGYFILAFLARAPSALSSISPSQIQIPPLIEGTITIQTNLDGNITLNDDGIRIGEPKNLVVFDTTRKILFNTFDALYSISQGSRTIDGVIKRDRMPRSNFATSLTTTDPSYDDGLKLIGMDPVATPVNSNLGGANRNPARIEHRELILEYEDDAQVQNNDIEIQLYDINSSIPPVNYTLPDRRAGRADTLSLSLIDPNFLMETTKGTVIDIFGNIIDINRNIIPIGSQSDFSVTNIKSSLNQSNTFKNVYEQIKRLERKSIAFHFEMNARKEEYISQFTYSPYASTGINDQSDYARARSRFFLDIDKEGQLKLNIPASSEVGNISLLTRYENYSTIINPSPLPNAPNPVIFNDNYQDIFIEPFLNTQVIKLLDENGNVVGPINRFSDPNDVVNPNNPKYIGHGTVYHNISKTINTLQTGSFYTPSETPITTDLASGRVVQKSPIVSPTITVAGPNANAGGRSASLNFDGSIEINIGANTVDRQSIWLDTQGGIVANIGRDLNTGGNVSLAANMDGEVIFQIGGGTVPAETQRFQGTTGVIPGVFDIRVFNANGDLTILRIDNEGMTITTPGRMNFYADENMQLTSNGTITLEAHNVIVNSRSVQKNPTAGPIR